MQPKKKKGFKHKTNGIIVHIKTNTPNVLVYLVKW